MASLRSRSPSTPSEGEIIESGSDTKATTSQTSVNGTNVDRPTRINSPRSPRPRRSRSITRSRSPFRDSRAEKRRCEDDYDNKRYRHGSRRFGARYDDRQHDRNYPSRRHRSSYHDYDRDDGYSGSLRYTDDYDRRRDKRPRTRSRSPYRDMRKPKQYSGDELEPKRDEPPSARPNWGGKRVSSEQSVSERGKTPVVAQDVRQEAETRENQVQKDSSKPYSRALNSTDTLVAKEVTGEPPPDEPMDEASRLEARRKRREAIKAKYRAQATPLLIQALQRGAETDSSTPTPGADTSSAKVASVSPHRSPLRTPNETPGTASPADFTISKDDDLANGGVVPMDGIEKEEASAADYDPTQDMREDRRRHDRRHFGDSLSAAAYDETKTTKQDIFLPDSTEQSTFQAQARDSYDMFAEDDDMFAEEPTDVPRLGLPTHATAKAAFPQPQELDMSMMDNWDDPEGYYNVMLGELINGRYHVQQNLGKGMFSSVVRATDSKTGKLVAIKIIRQNDTMKKAGMKEIEILQQLLVADPDDKKHMIRFDRHFDHKGHLCMVFENLSMNLREVLKKFGRDVGLNLRAIRAYAQQMFLGLGLLRKCNLLHADLKPDNLLVNDHRNVLKICDLGSASPASENEITPYLVSRFYRAPEIILGIPYDYAIDVWSIGCTLFELYTGKILFTGRNNNQMLRSIMECRGKFPPKLLRRGTLTNLHFDDLLNFQSTEEDKITSRVVTRVLDFKKPTRDLKTRLMGKGAKGLTDGEARELTHFVDLLDRCLNPNPEKRCTPMEALKHPFIARTRT